MQVDLVVCTTRVDLHYETIKPSLLKGKSVYCEWPLASNVKAAEELDALAKENNAKTIIGLQGELSPIILKLKSLIDLENKIGKVLSSSIIAAGGTRTRDRMTEGLKYFTRKVVGGNIVTIGFGHMIDFVMLVLGELSDFRSQLNIQRPQVPIIGSDGSLLEIIATDVADHIMLQGTLSSGAPLSVTFRRGPPFLGTPGFIWSIHGEKGEIRFVNSQTMIHSFKSPETLSRDSRAHPESIVLTWRNTTGLQRLGPHCRPTMKQQTLRFILLIRRESKSLNGIGVSKTYHDRLGTWRQCMKHLLL